MAAARSAAVLPVSSCFWEPSGSVIVIWSAIGARIPGAVGGLAGGERWAIRYRSGTWVHTVRGVATG